MKHLCCRKDQLERGQRLRREREAWQSWPRVSAGIHELTLTVDGVDLLLQVSQSDLCYATAAVLGDHSDNYCLGTSDKMPLAVYNAIAQAIAGESCAPRRNSALRSPTQNNLCIASANAHLADQAGRYAKTQPSDVKAFVDSRKHLHLVRQLANERREALVNFERLECRLKTFYLNDPGEYDTVWHNSASVEELMDRAAGFVGL